MCKTGKKIFKINIFGSTKDMKKKITNFYDLAVSRTNEKNNERKKKRAKREARMGYCPYMVLSHDTADCIVT